jgi:hypothetical protein
MALALSRGERHTRREVCSKRQTSPTGGARASRRRATSARPQRHDDLGPTLGAIIRAGGYRVMFAAAAAVTLACLAGFTAWDRGGREAAQSARP